VLLIYKNMANKKMEKNGKKHKEHESSVRKIIDRDNYNSFKNLNEAKKYGDSFLIMEGDWGGQIYLVYPVKLIKCEEKRLLKLLQDLDKLAWDEKVGKGIYFERFKEGEIVPGGMGGGIAPSNLWVHDNFKPLIDKIKKVLNGELKSLP